MPMLLILVSQAIQIHEDAIFPLLHLLMRQLELLSIGSASRKSEGSKKLPTWLLMLI